MTLAEMLAHCHKQVQMQGSMGRVVLPVYGRAPKSGRKRLFGSVGGPMGEVVEERVQEEGDGYYCQCLFDAAAVVDAIEALVAQARWVEDRT